MRNLFGEYVFLSVERCGSSSGGRTFFSFTNWDPQGY